VETGRNMMVAAQVHGMVSQGKFTLQSEPTTEEKEL
jgi:hypothetical protein